MKKILISLILLSLLQIGCQSKKSNNAPSTPANRMKQIVVKELIEGSTYSYIKGADGSKDIWAAIRKQPIEVGKTYYYTNALEMANFHSKELNRDFPLIYFLNSISSDANPKNPYMGNAPHGMKSSAHMMKPVPKKVEVKVDFKKGITSIKDVYQNKDKLANSIITVKGKVTKFNKNIMNRNWIHIQDGTVLGEDFDLTITSNDMVSIGQMVEFKGTLAVDKDFGAGYSYSVILEKAEIQKD